MSQSNQTAWKEAPTTGHNGWPLHGTMAHVHAAAHIAENCPIVGEPQYDLRRAICEMRFHAFRVRQMIEKLHESGEQPGEGGVT